MLQSLCLSKLNQLFDLISIEFKQYYLLYVTNSLVIIIHCSLYDIQVGEFNTIMVCFKVLLFINVYWLNSLNLFLGFPMTPVKGFEKDSNIKAISEDGSYLEMVSF